MLYLSITLVFGMLIGSLITTKYLSNSHSRKIQTAERVFTDKLSLQEIKYHDLSTDLVSLKSESDEQRVLTTQKIGEAFHAGSEMMEKMSESLNHILDLVSKTESPIQNITNSGDAAQDMIVNSQSSMENMSNSLAELSSISVLVNELSTHMDQVSKKTDVIHNIANQANLLSLNAAIEAARAGDAGRGFSVVANDMNRLSDLSATAALEISKIISDGISNLNNITTEMDSKIETFTNVSNKMLVSFQNMDAAIQSIGSLTDVLKTDSQMTIEDIKKISEQSMTTMETLTKMLSDVTGFISGNAILDLEPNTIHDHLNEYTIIDVRNPNEFNDDLGHLDQATLYCLQDNFKHAMENLNKDTKYLFVCRSGGRSARGARIAQALGFSDVSNLNGGMLKWRQSYPKVA